MTSLVRLEADEGSVELRLEAYEFPDLATGADANWIIGQVRLESTSLERGIAVQPLYFRTDELEQLRDELEVMIAGDSDWISTAHIEEQFGITIARTEEDMFTIGAWISDHDTRESVRSMRTDSAGLGTSLNQLVRATETFPSKGDLYG